MLRHQGMFSFLKRGDTELKYQSKIWIKLLCIAFLFLCLVVYVIWSNLSIQVTEYTISGNRLPESFSGFRIAQVSDLHNAEFGKDNSNLLKKLKEAQPDMIVLTGDLIDSRRTDMNVAISFAEKAVNIAPTYYIPGNHESRIAQLEVLYKGLSDAGVTLLLDDSVQLQRGNDSITLAGILDISFRQEDPVANMKEVITDLVSTNDSYTILLSHSPEFFEIYASRHADLVLTGHVHGGQFRLPFLGGVYAPGQGFFPKYDAGLFTDCNTNMIISRGLGNSIFPFRLNNNPEIVIISLRNS